MSLILIDNGEGGTGDDILNTQFLADSLDEGGLSCTHLAVEGKHFMFTDVLYKLTS